MTVLIGSLLTIAGYCALFSSGRILWSDELFGWMLITDPSWHHMLQAWRDGADGGGIVFYTTCRLWLNTFGQTVLAFRAYSAFACWVGFVATWLLLRRYYQWRIATIIVIATWAGSRTVLWQMVQTRFYGLLLATVALCSLEAARRAHADKRFSLRDFFTTAGAHFLLVGSHPFGILYSAMILLGSAVSDVWAGRRRPLFYLAAVCPWTLLLFSRQALENSARVGKPYFWTTRPGLSDLVSQYHPYGLRPIAVSFVIVLALLYGLASSPVHSRIVSGFRERSFILIPALLLSLMPLSIWILSQHGTSYFVDRYLIGSVIGVAILLAELSQAFACAYAHKPFYSLGTLYASAAGLCLLLILIGAFWRYPRTFQLPTRDYTNALAADFPPGLPVVIDRVDIFTVTIAQQHAHALPVYFLLDWDTVLSPDSPRGQVSGYHEMENWQREGYYSGSIIQFSDFLRDHDKFLVLRDNDVRWLDHRILPDSHWKARQLNTFSYSDLYSDETIWLVERQ